MADDHGGSAKPIRENPSARASCGVGRHLISLIALEALLQGRRCGIRLLILEALPEAVAFYERCGFRLTRETRRERGKRNRTMFLDLLPLEDLAQ